MVRKLVCRQTSGLGSSDDGYTATKMDAVTAVAGQGVPVPARGRGRRWQQVIGMLASWLEGRSGRGGGGRSGQLCSKGTNFQGSKGERSEAVDAGKRRIGRVECRLLTGTEGLCAAAAAAAVLCLISGLD